jgi:hypothetical protein
MRLHRHQQGDDEPALVFLLVMKRVGEAGGGRETGHRGMAQMGRSAVKIGFDRPQHSLPPGEGGASVGQAAGPQVLGRGQGHGDGEPLRDRRDQAAQGIVLPEAGDIAANAVKATCQTRDVRRLVSVDAVPDDQKFVPEMTEGARRECGVVSLPGLQDVGHAAERAEGLVGGFEPQPAAGDPWGAVTPNAGKGEHIDPGDLDGAAPVTTKDTRVALPTSGYLRGVRPDRKDLAHVLRHGGERAIAVPYGAAKRSRRLNPPDDARQQDGPNRAGEEHAAGYQGAVQAGLGNVDRQNDPDREQVADLHAGRPVDAPEARREDGEARERDRKQEALGAGKAEDDANDGAEEREGAERRQSLLARRSGIGEAGKQRAERRQQEQREVQPGVQDDDGGHREACAQPFLHAELVGVESEGGSLEVSHGSATPQKRIREPRQSQVRLPISQAAFAISLST